MVVLGVGSELRSDDAVGLRASALAAERGIPGVIAISGGPAPENATADIRRHLPSFVIIVDAADMGEPPGTIRVIDSASVRGASFGTHGLPLSVLAAYLHAEMGCGVVIVGIQPASVEYGQTVSAEAEAAAGELVDALAACLG